MDIRNINKAQELQEKLNKIDSMYELFSSSDSIIRKLKFKIRENWSYHAFFTQKKFKSEDFEQFLNLEGVVKKAIAESLHVSRVKIIKEIKEF